LVCARKSKDAWRARECSVEVGPRHYSSGLRIYIVRPGFVQPQGAVIRNWIIGKIANAILLEDLAVAIVDAALSGCGGICREQRAEPDCRRWAEDFKYMVISKYWQNNLFASTIRKILSLFACYTYESPNFMSRSHVSIA
jgi:hypothetical protein